MTPTTTTVANQALGGIEACIAISRVTLLRTMRGRALWVVMVLCLVPLVYTALVLGGEGDIADWDRVLGIWGSLLAIVPPVVLASAIGEEIEERTMTYLWSRPLPRWSILGGKLVALIPVLWVFLAVALVLPFYTFAGPEISSHPELLGRSLLVVFAGTLGASAATAGLATLAPRYGTALSIGYLLFIDGGLALANASISKLSVLHNALQLAKPDVSVGQPLAWLLGLSALWIAIAVWRVRRIE